VREHYEIEKEIAARLRDSTSSERTEMYTRSYDELFRRVPHHPLLHTHNVEGLTGPEQRELKILKRFIGADSVYVEVGPGDCRLALEIAKHAKQVIAVDVSNEITKRVVAPPPNFTLLISDGTSIPIEPASADVVHSNQLMEHLHPDDAVMQLKNVFNALKPNGVYYCVTPNRLSGPHDISRNFDVVATGLHLKEYSIAEMEDMLKRAGFSRTRLYLGYGGLGFFIFPWVLKPVERIFALLPHSIRKKVTVYRAVRLLLGIRMAAWK
jgi:SAM-dependent methyltransferase